MTELPGWSLMFRLEDFIAVSTSISRKCVFPDSSRKTITEDSCDERDSVHILN